MRCIEPVEMGCLKLTYNETNNVLTEVSPLKVVYVNPELSEKTEVDFLGVGKILDQSGGNLNSGDIGNIDAALGYTTGAAGNQVGKIVADSAKYGKPS